MVTYDPARVVGRRPSRDTADKSGAYTTGKGKATRWGKWTGGVPPPPPPFRYFANIWEKISNSNNEATIRVPI